MINLLIVEDENNFRKGLATLFQRQGMIVHEASNGREGLKQLSHQKIDIIITDIMMPEMDGLAFTQHAKKKFPQIPVVMLTAKYQDQSELEGFGCGANDYIKKPFKTDLLIARVKAQLGAVPQQPIDKLFVFKELSLNLRSMVLTINHQPVVLQQKEALLLSILMDQPGKIFNNDEIEALIWSERTSISERSVANLIHRIRQKMEPFDSYLQTIYGLGYVLKELL